MLKEGPFAGLPDGCETSYLRGQYLSQKPNAVHPGSIPFEIQSAQFVCVEATLRRRKGKDVMRLESVSTREMFSTKQTRVNRIRIDRLGGSSSRKARKGAGDFHSGGISR